MLVFTRAKRNSWELRGSGSYPGDNRGLGHQDIKYVLARDISKGLLCCGLAFFLGGSRELEELWACPLDTKGGVNAMCNTYRTAKLAKACAVPWENPM
jgi:hypothetical protein